MREKGSSVRRDSEVARLLTESINGSSRSQADIADKLGYPRPNMVTMIKQGLSRLPFDKLSAMAGLVNIDTRVLFETALREYEPNIFKLVDQHYIQKPARDVEAVLQAAKAGKSDAKKALVSLTKEDLDAIRKIVSDAAKR